MTRRAPRRARLATALACAAALITQGVHAYAAGPTPRVFTNADLPQPVRPSPAAPARDAGEVAVRGTGEAALAQPMVGFELRDGRTGKALEHDAKAHGGDDVDGLVALIGSAGRPAILDTGASAHLLSGVTASAYGVTPDSGARYVETGMTGEHAMGVSRELGLALLDGARRPVRTFTAQRFLLNDAPSDIGALLLSPGAVADVIGMPAIRELVTIVDTAAPGAPLVVRLAPSAPPADLWLALTMADFSQRRHAKNRGALPTLAANPLVEKVGVRLGPKSARGDWLLDSGAAVTMISTRTATALGLVAANGRRMKEPAFSVPVGGIGGGHEALDGYRVERVEIPTDGGRTLVFEDAAVVVHDVTIVGDDGSKRTLDGVLGMNLLLPSGSGLGPLGFTSEQPGPFTQIVIDGPRARLGLTTRR